MLFVSPRKAWPPISGARLRDFYFAHYLAAQFPLTYLYFGEGDSTETRQHMGAAAVEAIPAPSRYGAGQILRGIVGRMPISVVNYTSAEMHNAIARLLQNERFEVVHLESLHLAAYLPTIRKLAPQALTVIDWHNIESELMSRYAENAASFSKRMYARFTARKLYHLEGALLHECSGHIVCSDREVELLTKRNPLARIALIENGVDTKRFRPAANPGQEPIGAQNVVFVGQMSYHANVEASRWFAGEIWPAVRERFPQLKLSIVGSDPTPAVWALAEPGSITVTGTVPDVLPFYQDAFASVVPLQTGGGTRLKILEAMASGTPVISTAVGAEGLRVTHGENIQIVNGDVRSWLAAFAALADTRYRHAQIARARELVAAQYDWESISDKLADTYRDWLDRGVRG